MGWVGGLSKLSVPFAKVTKNQLKTAISARVFHFINVFTDIFSNFARKYSIMDELQNFDLPVQEEPEVMPKAAAEPEEVLERESDAAEAIVAGEPEDAPEAENPVADEEPSMVLRTEGLIKRYGKRTVVNDVSIKVRQGEIVGLLGPNGAGKTTSFYMTTGLIVPNGGHIYLDDKDITGYPVYKRARAGIGYLPQEASVFRKLSVEDNIMAVLEMTGKPRDYQLQKLESLIAEFRLGKVRKNKGDQLSGGERRRTEIADRKSVV